MTDGRDQRWQAPSGVAGGFAMFIIEALVIAAVVAVALIVSIVVLALI